MNRIDKTFLDLDQKGEKALVGFVTAGDPTPERSLQIIQAMCRTGLDILELGIPFSDPTADGPIIQRSSQRAIKNGTTVSTALEIIKALRKETEIPIILFSYYNPIFIYGADRFYRDAIQADTDGVLVVDLPPEESAELTEEWPDNNLSMIRLVAPTTPQDRMSLISGAGKGFLYLISKTGVTGSDGLNMHDISEKITALRSVTELPICVGFGISSPENVADISSVADGVVIGSAFERMIEEHIQSQELPSILSSTVQSFKKATRLRIGIDTYTDAL
jgi:tryptophan synthase alpha chain